MATNKAAAKAAPASKKATNKSASTALTLWEKQMAEAVVKQQAAEKPVGGFKSISFRGGIISVDDSPVADNELRIVVLASAHENQYYTSDFDSDNPTIPACYAFSEVDGEEDGMAPHAESSDRQGDDNGLCANCWANKMGSAERGKGKACKNVRRLVVVTEDALESADSLDEAEARMMKIPVMSVKGWAKYVRETLAEEIKRPTWGVVTRVKLVPDPKSQFRVVFAFEELVNFDQSLFDAIQRKIKSVSETLVAPYVQMEQAEEPPAKPQRGRPAPAAKPVKPVGRMAQAMQGAAAKQAAGNGARKAKY